MFYKMKKKVHFNEWRVHEREKKKNLTLEEGKVCFKKKRVVMCILSEDFWYKLAGKIRLRYSRWIVLHSVTTYSHTQEKMAFKVCFIL